MKRQILKVFGNFMAVILTIAATGCSVPKNVTYFQDTDAIAVFEAARKAPIKVKAGDKLAIVVKSKDPALSSLFNLPTYSNRIGQGNAVSGTGSELRSYTVGTSDNMAAYNVSSEGTIDFPFLGTLNVAGMTRAELSGFIKGELMGRDLIKDPTVIVEFLNTGVNVMGEVAHPGRYDMNVDNLSVLQALALAGDLTINGQRQNVKVIREENGKVTTYTLDLTDAAGLMKSPAYYLQQNDVVYVEPDTMKKRSTTVNGNNALSVGFWVSVASLLTSVVTTIAVFINK